MSDLVDIPLSPRLQDKGFTALPMAMEADEEGYVAIGREVAAHNGDDFNRHDYVRWLEDGRKKNALSGIELRDEKGDLAGLVVYSINPVSKSGVIDMIWSGSRRQGLGAELMQQAFRDLAAEGITEVSLWVGSKNHTAQRMYEKTGWSQTEMSATHLQYERPLSTVSKMNREPHA